MYHFHAGDLPDNKELLRILVAQKTLFSHVFLMKLVALLIHVRAFHEFLP